MKEKIEFNFDEILKEFRDDKRLTGKDGLLAPLIKQLTEAALEAEVESHTANDVLSRKSNRRNGFNKKLLKVPVMEHLNQRHLVIGMEPLNLKQLKNIKLPLVMIIEEKIISMYGLGMSYRDIFSHIEDIYIK